MGRGVPEYCGDDLFMTCTNCSVLFKLSVILKPKNPLRVLASTQTDFVHGCVELLVKIIYVIYMGIIIYNTKGSLILVVLRQ